MKLIKKLLAVMFVLALLVSCGPAQPKPVETPSETPAETPTETPTEPVETGTGGQVPTKNPQDTLVVGNPGQSGFFISGWGNNAYDVWVRNLIHGYSTYVTDEEGRFVWDPVTLKSEPEVTEDADGNKTYKYTLQENLVWNDGTPIKAQDYVFGILFTDSPEMKNTGSGAQAGDTYVGYKEYREGTSKSFAGVKLLGEYEFSVTLSKEYLPYFYEEAAASVGPAPMHAYAPNLVIGADGSSLAVKEGYTLSDTDVKSYQERLKPRVDKAEADVTAEKEAIDKALADKKYEKDSDAHKAALEGLDALEKAAKKLKEQYDSAAVPGADGAVSFLLQSGAYWVADSYRLHPTVTAGAYNFVSYENEMTTVTLNDKYLGNFQGKKPTIKNVVVKKVNSDLDIDMVMTGDIDIADGVIQGQKIDKVRKAADKVSYNNYPRNAYGMINFINNGGATKHKEVRQAVGFLLDRAQFVQNYLSGYGSLVHAEYGLAQWMYQAKKDDVESKTIPYTLDYDKANASLDNSPYKFEKDGTTPWSAEKAIAAYDANKEGFDYWRYDADGKQLRIDHFGTEDNEITDIINTQLPDQGKKAGLQYVVTYGDFPTLFVHYLNQAGKAPDEREFQAFNLATSFTAVYDPYYSYHSDFIDVYQYNTAQVNDPKADELLIKLRQTVSTDPDAYADAWLEWVLWFNENLPKLPLYSNDVHDVYHPRVKGLKTTPVWNWSMDIVNLSLEYGN